jgi:hypothetical protein
VSSTLDRLLAVVDAEGLEEGTPAYERRLLLLRVDKCVELQGVASCSECKAFEHCEYARDMLRLKASR